jgi:hypothetical protein
MDGEEMTGMTSAAGVPARPGLAAELREAITPRTVSLVIAVLLLQMGFILSYIGAFHAAKPHQVPVAVVAPAQAAPRLAAGLNAIGGQPVHAVPVASQAVAAARVRHDQDAAAFIVSQAGTNDTLLVASGGGASVVTAVDQVAVQADAARHRTVTVRDLVPLQPGDGRGLTGFYLVIGWIVGGYLVAALLGVAKGPRPATARRAVIRLLAIAAYAVASGLGGALVVDQGLGALTGHFVALWWLGALLVYAAAAVTMAFQALLGVLGIGLTVLIFVVLGNPSAGGAYQAGLLPPFWRAISPALPNGAGTDAVRRIVYFAGQGITGHLAVIAAYAIAGMALTVLISALREQHGRHSAPAHGRRKASADPGRAGVASGPRSAPRATTMTSASKAPW